MSVETSWGFCGYGSQQNLFWSPSLSVYTNETQLTYCFRSTVLSWIPCAWLWLSAPVYLAALSRSPNIHSYSSTSIFNRFKTVFAALLAVVASLDLWKSIDEAVHGYYVIGADFVTPIIQAATFILACFIIPYEHVKGVSSGGVLWLFWFLLVVCGVGHFRSYVLESYTEWGIKDKYRAGTFFVHYVLLVVQFLLHQFSDHQSLKDTAQYTKGTEKEPLLTQQKDEQNKKPDDTPLGECPMARAPILSRMLYVWITGLIFKGYRRSLVFRDLWSLLPEDTCRHIVGTFEKAWEKEVEYDREKRAAENRTERDKYEMGAYTKLRPEKVGKYASVFSAIKVVFGPYYVLGAFYKVVYDLLDFISPALLGALVNFVGDDDNPYTWQGYLLAVLLFINSMVRTIVGQAYWNVCFITGMRLRTACIGAVYRKALRLNSESRRSATVGEIVNLMSVDAQKFQDAPIYLHMLWSAPLIIALALYFLWQELGPSSMAGFGVLLLMVPINAYIGATNRKLQVTQMDLKDNRIKLLNEVLNGIKVLKLYAWERRFSEKLSHVRDTENDVLIKSGYLTAVSAISWFLSPYLVSLASFAVYVNISPENILDAKKAFVALSLFNIMNFPMSILPSVVSYAVQATVSIERINSFLKQSELDPNNVTTDPSEDYGVKISSGTFSWGQDDPPVLKNISLTVPRGGLVAVVGSVGAGKSSLVSAMLGEMEVIQGKTTLSGGVAYVPQQAWIQNDTLKGNILFGKPLDQAKYKKAIDACALTPDLRVLSGGDQTEIGEKGINLSGGQKQRVSLARAVYQDADIYLFDDPLSAVDAHVGKHIFDEVIGPDGLLKRKTRVLVTNALGYLPQVDNIVCLRDGAITEVGTYQQLLNAGGWFSSFIQSFLNDMEEEEETDSELAAVNSQLRRDYSSASGNSDTDARDSSSTERRKKRRRPLKKQPSDAGEKQEKKSTVALTVEEVAEEGSVQFGVLRTYIKACGIGRTVIGLISYVIYTAAQCFTNIWLSLWSVDPPVNGRYQDPQQRDLRLGVYGAAGAVQVLTVMVQSLMIAVGCVEAVRYFHGRMLGKVMRAPMSFFDTTPLGRIVNRFSKDVDTMDIDIPLALRIWFAMLVALIQIIIVITYSTPVFLALVVPLGILYFFIQRSFIRCTRQLKRIESIRRSPIFAHFGETVVGVSSIRAYRVQQRFSDMSDKKVDENQMAYFPNIMACRWLGIWLEFVGNLVVLFAAILAVANRFTLSSGAAGLSIAYSLQTTVTLNLLVRMTCDLETFIVSVERCEEYMHVPVEAAPIVENNRPQLEWPDQGMVRFDQYSTRYRAGLDLVLRDVNCTIQPGEKVGIVGRTGAGKSSLTLALFRLVEAAAGTIHIDGVHIGKIGLDDLRSKLTIIPQDPVIFSGSLRMNLDPSEQYSDSDMWSALHQAHLKTFVSNQPDGLDYECSEGGENLSVGQRQLVCLARALLRKTRILVLDEATAAIDLETDDLIQTTIRNEFKECTVITIAHRLNTIMDYDKIVVLDKGRIKEFGSPSELLEDRRGIFHGMARDAGLV